MKFSEKLMQLRKEKGLSQEALGELLNVSRQTVSKWELAQTTPELNKLIEISRIFSVTIDELVTDTAAESDEKYREPRDHNYGARHLHYDYEYKSKRSVKGLPLVHINIGPGMKKARGIISIGTISTGIISIGMISRGVLSLGLLSFGLFTLGGLSIGGLAVGGLALGLFAVGGAALGILTVGGLSVGIYALGGAAFGSKIAFGDYASAYIAIGDRVNGTIEFITGGDSRTIDSQVLRSAITDTFPKTWRFIVEFFVSLTL